MDSEHLPTVSNAADGVSTLPMPTAENLPSLSSLHIPLRAVRDMARDAGYGDSFFSKHIMNNVVFGPGRWANRLESMPGNTYSKELMDVTGTQFDPGSNLGAGDLMNWVRFSSGETTARMTGNALENATEAQRIVIFRNAVMKTLFHMARVEFPEGESLALDNPNMEQAGMALLDGDVKKAINTRLMNHIEATGADGSKPGTAMGFRFDGDPIKGFKDDEGVTVQGAITPNQRGMLSIPNIVEARRMAAAVRQAKTSMFLGGVDDFFYDHVTQGFFKPLVLLSGAYAFHIALAELIPNTLRHGLRASVDAVRSRALAAIGYNAEVKDPNELDGLTAWLYRTLGGAGVKSKQKVGWLIQSREANGGAAAADSFGSGAHVQAQTTAQGAADEGVRQVMAQGYREGKRFHGVDTSSPRYNDALHAELAQNVNRYSIPAADRYRQSLKEGKDWNVAMEDARQTVARRIRAERDAGHEQLLARSNHPMEGAPPTWDGPDGHAQAVVDKLMGAVHGRPTQFDDAGKALAPGPVNDGLLASIAHGRVPTREEVNELTDAQKPLMVKARDLVPLNDGWIQRAANFGFKKLLNPMVNIISRNQEYTIEYLKLREELQPLIDQGLRSEDEVLTIAMAKATQHGLRFVHNLHDRTQWTATMRNWAPFYFAQEQAYRRMGRLFVEDPGAFRRYQLMISGVHNLAATLQDSNGNQYIGIPGAGFLGTGVADIMGESGLTAGGISPSSLGGSFSSANVIFPLSQGIKPDLGPLAIIPAAQLSAMFTELNRNYAGHNQVLSVLAKDLSDVAGSEAMSQSLWEQIIPNPAAQRILQAALGDDRSFNSAVMQTYQLAAYQQAVAEKAWLRGGRKGPEPEIVPPANATAMQKQQFQDKIRNLTRMNFFVRALVGFWSPISASVVVQNLGIPAHLNAYITKEGSVSLGMQAAYLDHPEWAPWMVSESYVPSEVDQTQTSGYSLSSSIPAQQWVGDNQTLLDHYGVAALWLMPQLTDATYSPTIYNEQIAQGLRLKDTPDQFLAALYTNAGNNLYYSALKIHESALTAAGNNTRAVNAEYDNWNSYVATIQKQNPVWAENFLSANQQLNRQNAIKQLTAIFDDGNAPPGPMTDSVEFLLNQYNQAAANCQAAGQEPTYSMQLAEQKKVNDGWIAYVTDLETSQPQLRAVINGVFKEALRVRTS